MVGLLFITNYLLLKHSEIYLSQAKKSLSNLSVRAFVRSLVGSFERSFFTLEDFSSSCLWLPAPLCLISVCACLAARL